MTPDQIKRDTALFGLVGDALEKTPLPSLINSFYDYNRLNAFCSIFNIREEDIPFFLTNLKTRPIAGIFIEPSRQAHVLEYIDSFSPVAEKSRAVDGAVIKEGKLYGYNFKAEGIAAELAETAVSGMCVALMGSSPAALAAGMEIASRKPESILLVDASPEAAMETARAIRDFCGFDAFEIARCAAGMTTDLSRCDAVINGMAIEEEAAFSELKSGATVYDIAGSFGRASWQKGVRYFGPLYMTMLQLQGMSDRVLGCESRIDPEYMHYAEVIEIF